MKLLPAIILTYVVLFSVLKLGAQEVFGTGSKFQAMADASCAAGGCWSVFGNQAGLNTVNRPEIAGSFQNRFLVSQLSNRIGLFVFPFQNNVFSLAYSQFGKIPFRQEKIGVAYARKVGRKIGFGVQFNRYGVFLAEENKTALAYGLEIGTQYYATSKFTIGAHFVNPYQSGIKFSNQTYRYDSNVSLGTFFRISEAFSWTCEVENRFDKHVLFKSGFECGILNHLVIRTGVSGKPYLLSAGFGLQLKMTTIDFATTYNQNLGNSPSVSFQYQF